MRPRLPYPISGKFSRITGECRRGSERAKRGFRGGPVHGPVTSKAPSKAAWGTAATFYWRFIACTASPPAHSES